MQYSINIPTLQKPLYSILVMCLFCLLSTKGIAKNDSQSSLTASTINFEFSSIEAGLDDGDTPEPFWYDDISVDLNVFNQKVIFYHLESTTFQSYNFINVRAPPLS